MGSYAWKDKWMRRPENWAKYGLVAIFVAAVVASLLFGMRSYRSGLLLYSAYAVNAPDLGSMRAWMTLGYVSRLYDAPEGALLQGLGLAASTGSNTTLRSLALQEGVAPLLYVQRVQRAVAAAKPNARSDTVREESGRFSLIRDEVLAALLLYGYPALAATLVVGSIGVPLPDGLLTAAAGSLIAQHRMEWAPAGIVSVAATVIGDMAGYYLGLWLGAELLDRRGQWFGYTPARRRRVQRLFEQWGWVGVLLTRTFISSISPVVNLAAGAGRYRPGSFLGAALIGRIFWTGAYLGAGYAVSGALEAANGFLTNLGVLLAAVGLSLWSAWMLTRRRDRITMGS